MSTRQFNISALSPLVQYDPQEDAQGANSPWVSDEGGLTNNNANTGNPGRVLHGTGTATITGFGSGLSFAGNLQGVYCSYTATLTAGKGNTQDPSTFPAEQSVPPATGMLASFTGLEMDNWQLQLKGDCDNGSFVTVTQAIIDGWVGVQGATVTSQVLDDTNPQLIYSGVDWSEDSGLSAPFYNDTQHYTPVDGATMNFTFSGSAIVVYASVDPQHGPYSVEIHKNSSSYNSQNAVQFLGTNTFLAVPVPFYFVSGLDPTERYTIVLENKSDTGQYLDLDSITVITATGGGPPNGGTSVLQGSSSNSAPGVNKNTTIIAAAVGGGVALFLLILLLYLWRRRKTKVQRGVRPIIDNKSSIGHSPIPLHGNMSGSPYNSQNQYEQQGLLPAGPGSPSFPPITVTTSVTSNSAFDPYAAYGGYSTPPGSAYTGLASAAPDHVQRRRQGKAAEAEAARERMRLTNAGSIASPTTPHPTSTVSQSWDTSSQTAASSVPSAPHNTKTPEEPPPSYEQP